MSSLNTSSKTDTGQLRRYQPLYLGFRSSDKELQQLAALVERKVDEKLSEITTRINNLEGFTGTVTYNYDIGDRQLQLNFERGTLKSSTIS